MLLDSGATQNFIDHATVARLRLGTKKLDIPQPVFNVDGTLNRHGTITHACDLMIIRGSKKERQRFYITNLGKDRFILGYPWFRTFNPEIDWINAELKGPKLQMETLLLGRLQRVKSWIKEKKNDEDLILEVKRTCAPWSGVTPEETKGGRVEINRTHNATEMAHKYAQEHGKEEVKLPSEFKRHDALFSDEEAKKFPPSRS